MSKRASSIAPALPVLLVGLIGAACGGDRRPPRDAAEEDPAPVEEPPPNDRDADREIDRERASRPARSFAFALDQSASMAGFAEAKMIELITEAAGLAFQAVVSERDTVPFYSLGAKVEKVGEKQLWDRGRFRQSRADLVAAVAASELTEADLAVIVTDGQPTGEKAARATCSALGTEDVRALAGVLGGFLDEGRGVWLVFQRRRFQGTAFLNCSAPTQAIKDALAKKARFSCGKECSYRYDGERVVLTIVLAAADVDKDAEKFVAAYLPALGEGAEALRLHASASDRWSVRAPDIQLVNETSGTEMSVEGGSDAWTSELRCPSGEVAARVCMYAKAPANARAIAMGGLVAPTLKLDLEHPDDLYLLPGQTGFDISALRDLRADDSDCDAVWQRYQDRAAELAKEQPPVASSCEAKPGEQTAEVAVVCGCLRGAARRARLEWTQAHAPRQRAAAPFSERYSARAATWYQEPDRINGLAALLEALADRPGEGKAARIGRLELTLHPPN